MISRSYFQIGIFHAMAGMASYFFVMSGHGFPPSILVGIRQTWDRMDINDLMDEYGQEWVSHPRKTIIKNIIYYKLFFKQCAGINQLLIGDEAIK